MIKLANIDNSQQANGLANVDLTALIDIIFIVLVFLLLTANVPLLSLPLDVPQADNTALTQQATVKPIAVNILPNEPYFAIDSQPYPDWEHFSAQLTLIIDQQSSTGKSPQLIIAADKAAPVQPLMKLLALLQTQKITQTQILMAPE